MADRAYLTRFFTRIYVRVRKIIAHNFNLSALRRQFGASGTSILRVEIYDEDMKTMVFASNFRLGESEPERLEDSVKPDVILRSDYISAFDVLEGRVKRPARNGIKYQPYTINDAFREGRLTVVDNRSDKIYLNDLVLFQQLYRDVLPELQHEMGLKPVTGDTR